MCIYKEYCWRTHTICCDLLRSQYFCVLNYKWHNGTGVSTAETSKIRNCGCLQWKSERTQILIEHRTIWFHRALHNGRCVFRYALICIQTNYSPSGWIVCSCFIKNKLTLFLTHSVHRECAYEPCYLKTIVHTVHSYWTSKVAICISNNIVWSSQ